MPEIRRVIDELNEMKGSSPWTRTVIVDIGGKGDYTSIKAACDYVSGQTRSTTARWAIFVLPGRYDESPFTIPTFCKLIGTTTPILNSQTEIDCYIRFSATSGYWITFGGNASNIEGFAIASSVFPLTPTGDLDIFRITTGQPNINDVLIFPNILADTYNVSGIKLTSGSVFCKNIVINISGSIATYCAFAVNSGTGLLIMANCYFIPSVAGSTALKQSGSGSTSLAYCRLGASASDIFFATDISVTAGTFYVNNTPYKTSMGTIVNIDRWYPTEAAVREAPEATDTPLILKGASAQTANLTEWKNSADSVLASMDKDGKLSAAGFSAGASPGVSGSFTTVDGKTVTVTNGIITAIV